MIDADGPATLESALERHRVELTGYCYRMLGSPFEAEDAVQDTMVRAWKGYDRFEGRAQLRSWLYRIATNVCLDMLGSKERKVRPTDFMSVGSAENPSLTQHPENTWLAPTPDHKVLVGGDPADVAVARDSVRLAFVAALHHLPARQRAVLILREVLCWQATEVAELLDTSVASVNSALQRARATLAATDVAATDLAEPADEDQKALLAKYVKAFESYDLEALAGLLHEDVTLSMPPYELWLLGAAEINTWMLGPGSGCRGSRLVPVESANGTPTFGQYRPSGPGGAFEPWALQVIEIHDGRIVGLNSFLDTDRLFPLFGLPPTVE
ncbi:sigma-70 family RNA polymerase sigma factor [Yinghuangia seranimata]|uniref:sigma-70 family RNA polymerase sigma factor n=1 Tax=Yinghuangia seranimata TaxID=408067 RepID=UPI00248C47A6|nr:sigma-70 family RNA polymerase sigma factor [Yinghuangia seranimata]MDI2125335.1 sigma-70 family RNA polymerase sigma factor [Yinghuangia seranimata]